MMRISAMMVAGLALAATACGSETSGEFTTQDGKNAEYTIDKNSGETSMTIKGADGDATLRSGADVPVSLPPQFALLPGSKVTNNTVVNQPDGQGIMVTFESPIPADKVIAHYKKQAVASGYAVEVELNTNGTLLLVAGFKPEGLTLTVTASPGQDGQTTGQIIAGSNKPG